MREGPVKPQSACKADKRGRRFSNGVNDRPTLGPRRVTKEVAQSQKERERLREGRILSSGKRSERGMGTALHVGRGNLFTFN